MDRRIGAIEDAEDFVFFFEDALNRCGSEDEKGLEFAEMEKAHQRIDIRGLQEYACQGRVCCVLIVR